MFKPSRLVRNSGTGNALTSYLVCKTMSCDENSLKYNKQTSSSEVRTKTASFMQQSSILVAWINEGKPSFLPWLGWYVSLSLEKEFDGAAGAILRWISFELWNSLDCTMGSCGGKYRSMALCTSLRDCVELYNQDLVKFLRRRLFQDVRIGTSFGGSFIHCFVEPVEKLRMF